MINGGKYTVEGFEGITFGADACVIEWEGDTENIYKPVKYSSATIQVVVDEDHFNWYSETPRANPIKVKDMEGNVVWYGYITPNIYNNDYDYAIHYQELECIDGLATMQYFKYEVEGAKKVITLWEVLKKCLDGLDYNKILISDNTNFSTIQPWLVEGPFPMPDLTYPDPTKPYLMNLWISECNFFDEDDEAMTREEVVQEMCKYLNLTLYAEGNTLYMIDQDGIRNGIKKYYECYLSNDSYSLIDFSNDYTLADDTKLIENSSLSIGNSYNRVKIESDLYPFDKMIPDMFEDIEQIGSLHSDVFKEVDNNITQYYYYLFFKNPNYKSYYYNKSTLSLVNDVTPNYENIRNYIGATLVRHSNQTYDTAPGIISSLNLDDYLLLHLHQEKGAVKYGNKLKLFETALTELDEHIIANYNNYLILNCTASWYDKLEVTAKGNFSPDYDPKGNYSHGDLKIPCSICYGGKYWYSEKASSIEIMGSTVWMPGWVEYETTFDLNFYANEDSDAYLYKDFDLRSNITYYMGLQATKGYAIQLTNIMSDVGNIKFTIYAPQNPNTGYALDSVFLKGFNINIETSKNYWENNEFVYFYDYNGQETDKSNVEYINEVNSELIEDFEDQTYKICTYAKSTPSNACVAWGATKEGLVYAQHVTPKHLGAAMREEEYSIRRIVNQYSKPFIILECTLFDDLPLHTLISNTVIDKTKKFLISSKSKDLSSGWTTYTLIEKQ